MSKVNVPKSKWVLEKKYFKVELHADFKNLWPIWLTECQWCEFCDVAEAFVSKMVSLEEVYVYQFPSDSDRSDKEADYFEMFDDNYVIPRHLFTLI